MGVVYVLEPDAYLSKDGGSLKVARRAGREVLLQKPLISVEEIVVLGNAVVTPALLKHCALEGIGLHYMSPAGTYYAGLTRTPAKNAPARVAQFKAHLDPAHKLSLARRFVLGKVKNGLVLLRRNGAEGWEALRGALADAEQAPDEDTLRGVEGMAADAYFRAFSSLLPEGFQFAERSRRPPRDPANSLLSLAYTLLAKECESALQIAGLDPYVGYLHEIRYGRASLALDLMEEFRSILADSVALSLCNNRRLSLEDFDDTEGYPQLHKEAWPKFLRAWEERLSERVRHPLLGKSLSYRQILLAQARILVKHLVGELPQYEAFTVR
ncbi:CRISPR-associated endonuclease Cas1 [Calidithermus roseus]|uniref:CRISPR-associated endonuclease Cas1 n=1 Tax=Calidithermus roseus TaxID=1644118 RepID=A0A399EZY4_9DEIN|nr:CRISPR-associated endonuclease Cas1 [Calidithermus roseus]RIH88966.1 CRISPR-associated endonuclease Cas1 [Calidithermus roseus]